MAKTATFGVLHLITSFSVTFALTGSVAIAGVVTFVEPLVNTVLHYFFDKYWAHPGLRSAVHRWKQQLRMVVGAGGGAGAVRAQASAVVPAMAPAVAPSVVAAMSSVATAR